MADFEEDPAADFLAREQDDLAELGEDFGGEQAPVNEIGSFGGGLDALDNEPVVNGFAEEIPGPHQPVVTLEPESVRKWREDKAALLDKMDSEEKEEIEEWRERAKKELNDWYERRDEQLGKTQASNRADEEAFVSDRDELPGGHDWERVCRMCDFNPKGTKNTKDVSRMRSIFLQLKQTPLAQ
ncbi:clathrin light chain A-like [Acropora muricata]|uniref:clathrin light chain A-like n=1 Tax=Acropora muricata TaxID=159855 RepID=UPI0034E60151